MRKILLVSCEFVIFALLGASLYLSCNTGNNIISPYDDYDHSQLFKVRVVRVVSSGYVEVEIFWLVEKLVRGDKPFSFGPQDAEWTANDLISLVNKTADGKYYSYKRIIETEKRYNVGAGLTWSGSNIHSSRYRWLTPSEQAGCGYFNPDPDVEIMTFKAYSDFSVHIGP
jgi:hypothetical protein